MLHFFVIILSTEPQIQSCKILRKAYSRSFQQHLDCILIHPIHSQFNFEFHSLHCVLVLKNYHASYSAFCILLHIDDLFVLVYAFLLFFYDWWCLNLDQNLLSQSLPCESRISTPLWTRLTYRYKEASKIIYFHSIFLASSL